MGRQVPEDDKFRSSKHLEKPMESGDATGAPTRGKRYNRALAHQAWCYLEQHDPEQPLPKWIATYLREVALRIKEDLGPKGGLSVASAHAAIGLIGEQWPEHHPDTVFMHMQRWMEDSPPLTRKAAAVRYIEEYMDGDPNITPEQVINRYKKGK